MVKAINNTETAPAQGFKSLMTDAQVVTLRNDLAKFKVEVGTFKANTHELAYRALTHAHNSGHVDMVQEFYNILADDKFISKSGFARWVQEYAPIRFNDETKKFSLDKAVNGNPTSVKKLYLTDMEKGSALLALAFQKKFWDMGKDDEDVNPTTWDVFYERLEKMVKRGKKDIEKGEVMETQDMLNVLANLETIVNAVKPHTTKELMLAQANAPAKVA